MTASTALHKAASTVRGGAGHDASDQLAAKGTRQWTSVLHADPVQGPACDSTIELGGCYHGSCQSIELNGRIHLAAGPLCDSADYLGDCSHESCQAIEPDQGYCTIHGWQLVTAAGVSRGFACGRVYWAELACGCAEVDESDDVRAAI